MTIASPIEPDRLPRGLLRLPPPQGLAYRYTRTQYSLVLWAVCSSCSDDLPEVGELVWAGENVEVWASEGMVACGGSFLEVEAHASRIRDFVQEYGVDSPPVDYRYFWFSDADRHIVEDVCGYNYHDEPVYACAVRDALYTPDIPDYHEITHAALPNLATMRHDRPRLLAEGVATMLGNLGFVADSNAPILIRQPPLESLVLQEPRSRTSYVAASHFVRSFIEQDPGLALRVFLQLRQGMDISDMRSTALEIGFPFDLAAETYENVALVKGHQARIHISECDQDSVPWSSDGSLSISGVIDCGGSRTLGPGRGEIWQTWTFDIPEREGVDAIPPGFRVEWQSSNVYRYMIIPCSPEIGSGGYRGYAQEASAGSDDSGEFGMIIPSGRYWIQIERDHSPPDDLDFFFRMSPLSSD